MTAPSLASFCRDYNGHRRLWPEWITYPFRYDGLVLATNGHCIVWREERPGDVARYPAVAKGQSIVDEHPGASACRRAWPTVAAAKERDAFGETIWTVVLSKRLGLKIMKAYRDRIRRLGGAAGVRYRMPTAYDKPIYFVAGEWRGALMGVRT